MSDDKNHLELTAISALTSLSPRLSKDAAESLKGEDTEMSTVPESETTASTYNGTSSAFATGSSSSYISSFDNDALNKKIRTAVLRNLTHPGDIYKRKRFSVKSKSIRFPVKLMYVLEECPEFEHIISWCYDGKSFVIQKASLLEEHVLPMMFKQAKCDSFLRKLYRWGFVKEKAERNMVYTNEKFKQGNYSLCIEMTCSKDKDMQKDKAAEPKAQLKTGDVLQDEDIMEEDIHVATVTSSTTPVATQARSSIELNEGPAAAHSIQNLQVLHALRNQQNIAGGLSFEDQLKIALMQEQQKEDQRRQDRESLLQQLFLNSASAAPNASPGLLSSNINTYLTSNNNSSILLQQQEELQKQQLIRTLLIREQQRIAQQEQLQQMAALRSLQMQFASNSSPSVLLNRSLGASTPNSNNRYDQVLALQSALLNQPSPGQQQEDARMRQGDASDIVDPNNTSVYRRGGDIFNRSHK